jgi:hypothetical protein
MRCYDIMGPWLRRSRTTRPAPRRRRLRLGLEGLEERTVPSSFTAATFSDLIADINAANLAGGSNSITLVAGNRFNLTVQDNDDYAATEGANGLPVIAAGDDLTVIGNGDIIERSTVTGTPAFRFFEVAAGASLTLDNLTLQGGMAFVQVLGAGARGGAIHSRGTLNLNGLTLQNNTAQGNTGGTIGTIGPGSPVPGGTALGGALYSSGPLSVQGCTFQNNVATGGRGGDGFSDGGGADPGTPGGNALGGALYIDGGIVAISNSTLTANIAHGGDGGNGYKSGTLSSPAGDGGNGFGGGMYAAVGTVSILDSSVTSNTAQGGAGGSQGGGDGGDGFGGGVYAGAGTVTIHNSSVATNTAQGGAGGIGPKHNRDGKPGQGLGGGIYIDGAALVGLDAFTVDHVKGNRASTKHSDIYGSYDVIL